MADMGDQPGQGQLIVHGEAGPRRKKMINLLNRSPSPVILEDYGALEPSKCTVGGPGIAGGIVGVATQVTVAARDSAHVHIREGGENFELTMKHSGKGAAVKTYESVDHGDGHYSFSGVRADLKGMHQLSVEVNGTLVGDSPYLVMFEIDDDAELTTENADGTMPVARKSAASSIKERIVFVQRMNPAMTPDGMSDIFAKFGRVMKCEKMLPAHDIWMIQYSRSEDADEAVTVNGSDIMGCEVNVALASNLGGVGTHPIIMQQLQHIQAMHFQEQQSTSWATQLAAQRASIRLAGGEVEELTDTRKRRKALALMARLQAKVEQSKASNGGGHESNPSLGGEGSLAAADGEPADGGQDLRHRPQDTRSKSRDRERSAGRDDRMLEERQERRRTERGRDDRDRDWERRSKDHERERRLRDDEYDRRNRSRDGRGRDARGRDRGHGRDNSFGRRDGDWRGDDRNGRGGRERRNDERDHSRHSERDRKSHGDGRKGEDRSHSRRKVERADERRGEDRRGGERTHKRSRERDAGQRDGDGRKPRDERAREAGRSKARDEHHKSERRGSDSKRSERDRRKSTSPGKNGHAGSPGAGDA